MKEELPKPPATPRKSFSVAIEQMASLLRNQIKLKDRKTQILPSSSLSPSLANFVTQVARILRRELHSSKSTKKRSWKKPEKVKKK